MTTATFEVPLPANFHRDVPLRWIGRDAESRTERVDGPNIAKALMIEGKPAVVHVALGRRSARCRVEVGTKASAPLRLAARHVIDRILGIVASPAPFERRAAREPLIARLITGRRGLRVPLTANVFESLVWTIAGQQVNLAFAYRLRRVVIELAGTPIGDFLAHPTAEAVAQLEYDDLTRRQWSRRKAEYVIDVARAVASGALDAEALPTREPARVREELEALRGFGVWSASYVMMRGCGFPDCVPLGDTGLTSALERFYRLDHRPGREETETLMAPFAPYRSLATFHLWAGGGSDD
jgi:3-methyladenine DNA glycosylase/8-oxoguanine DNA glycosylase